MYKHRHAGVGVTVVICHCEGTAYPRPTIALGFPPAFWDDKEGKAHRFFFPRGFLNGSLHFHESVAPSGDPPITGRWRVSP